MKKIAFLMIFSAFVFTVPAGAQAWSQLSSPGNEIAFIILTPGDTLYAIRPSLLDVSYDHGSSWQTLSIPTNMSCQYVDGVAWFKNRLYLSGGEGIVAFDGNNFSLVAPGYGFTGLCANSSYLFVFGHGNSTSQKFNGSVWTTINKPPNTEVVSRARANDSQLVGVNSSGTVYKSVNSGQTWTNLGATGGAPMSLSLYESQYDLVIITTSHTMSSRGQYTFDYDSGVLHAVEYLGSSCLMGGYQTISGIIQGIVFSNGNMASAVYFGNQVNQITSNGNMAVALVDRSGLYSTNLSTFVSGNQPVGANLTVYPNPTTGQIVIEAEKEEEVSLRNVYGETIKTMLLRAGKNVVDLSDLSAGLYYLPDGKKLVKK